MCVSVWRGERERKEGETKQCRSHRPHSSEAVFVQLPGCLQSHQGWGTSSTSLQSVCAPATDCMHPTYFLFLFSYLSPWAKTQDLHWQKKKIIIRHGGHTQLGVKSSCPNLAVPREREHTRERSGGVDSREPGCLEVSLKLLPTTHVTWSKRLNIPRPQSPHL